MKLTAGLEKKCRKVSGAKSRMERREKWELKSSA